MRVERCAYMRVGRCACTEKCAYMRVYWKLCIHEGGKVCIHECGKVCMYWKVCIHEGVLEGVHI